MDRNPNDISDSAVQSGVSNTKNVMQNIGGKFVNVLRRKGHTKGHIGNLMKKIIQLIVKVLSKILAALVSLGPFVIVFIIIGGFFLGAIWEVETNSRGTNSAYSGDPDDGNKIEWTENGLEAVALSEPQAIIDAYYKYMACQSYYKDYNGELFSFRRNTADFAGLSDYYDAESDYYLSPEFLAMADETLHGGEFRYPEHLIMPVSYTEAVNGAGERVLQTQSLLDTNGSPDRSLIADSGFASVLSYTPGVKDDYVQARVTEFQVDYDVRTDPPPSPSPSATPSPTPPGGDEMVPLAAEPETMPTYSHLTLHTFTIDPGETYETLVAKMQAYEDGLRAAMTDYQTLIINAPSETELRGFVGEEVYTKGNQTFGVGHMPQAVSGKDLEIDRTTFTSPALADFSNDGDGLYPINIALVSSAATFSGNIEYVYYTEPQTTELQYGTSPDMSDPVDKYAYSLSCVNGSVDATATKEGFRVIETPIVQSKNPLDGGAATIPDDYPFSNNPWGYEYFDAYVGGYTANVPQELVNDPDFLSRAQDPEVFSTLKELGLLVEYREDMSGLPSATADFTESDVELLAGFAEQLGSSTLDKLMLCSIVMNRVSAADYHGTIAECLSEFSAYNSATASATDESRAVARAVLSGRFAIPSNVTILTNDLYTSSNKAFLTTVKSNGSTVNLYCYDGDIISMIDRFGRSAPTAAMVRSMADSFEASNDGSDVAEGEKKLYAITDFDVLVATNLMRRVVDPNATWQSALLQPIQTIVDFFKQMESVFPDNSSADLATCVQYTASLNELDQRRIVYMAIAFRDHISYEDAAEAWKNMDGKFLFIGHSEVTYEASIISSVGSTLSGWVSPTTVACTAVSQSAGVSGQGVLMSAPRRTIVQALSDGEVTAVTADSITIEYEPVGSHLGPVYTSYYAGLFDITLTLGSKVAAGQVIGRSDEYDGTIGFLFEFSEGDEYLAPLQYFYRTVYAGGGSNIIEVALSEAQAYKANISGFDTRKYERWCNGTNTGASWCAYFVSWCGNQVYGDGAAFPKTGGAGPMLDYAKSKGVFAESAAYGGTYTPQPGDIIYYVWSGSGHYCSHVGLVVGVEGGKVITVEGNTSKPINEPAITSRNGIWQKAKNLNDSQIIGYGRFSALNG